MKNYIPMSTRKWAHFWSVFVPVCEVSETVGGLRDGTEGEEERVEVERALEGMKVEKAWASKPSAGDESLWKLWGLRGAEIGTKKTAEYIQEVAEREEKRVEKERNQKTEKWWVKLETDC